MTRALYTWLLRLAFPYVCLRLFVRGFGNHAYWRRLPERFGYIPRLEAAHVIWVHAVSVGEVRAAAPLVRALLERYPGHRLVVTAMTPTGSATVTQLFGDRVAHCYAPYDYPAVVRRFLARAHPALTLILEKELWPNLIHACRARGIPVCVANAQLGAHSLRGWQRAPRLARATFGAVNAYAAQSQADAQRLIAAGARPETVHVVGSIKFDLALPPELSAQAAALRRDWGAGRPVWLAASTHEGEEDAVLRAHAELRRRFPDLLLVLVPRHPERFGAVVKRCERAGFAVARRSVQRGELAPAVDVLVGDTLGELPLFYGACDAAFIGGSLVPAGGHNFLEAAAVGTPFVFGPDMHNIEAIAALAVERGAGRQLAHGGQMAEAIGGLLADAGRRERAGAAGRRLVAENRGALARTLQLIGTALSAASR
jgi:3-deoxy-D-manno-octulosonic-acid transferase